MTDTNVSTEAFNSATQAASQATERASQQIREFSEQAVAATRGFASQALDTYEQAVAGVIEFELKAAEAAPIDWVKTAIDAHVALIKDVNEAYVKAARGALV
jgi:hypothetical protein